MTSTQKLSGQSSSFWILEAPINTRTEKNSVRGRDGHVRRGTIKTGRAVKEIAAVAPSLPISDALIKDLKKLFKLLSDESRLRIVLALAREGRMHVSALCQLLGCSSQPAVSHHLTLMRALGVVDYTRAGRHNYYHLASGYIRTLLEQLLSSRGNHTRSFQLDDFVVTVKHK